MELKKFSKCLDTNKASGIGTIPPKLIEIAVVSFNSLNASVALMSLILHKINVFPV